VRRLGRLGGFSLVPLSLLPLAAVGPLVAPSIARRLDGTAPPALATAPFARPLANPLDVSLLLPGHARAVPVRPTARPPLRNHRAVRVR
jgi:hypothetical protein